MTTTVYDVTHGGLGASLTDAQYRALDRVRNALTAELSRHAAVDDPRGASPSAVARRAGDTLTDVRALLGRLVDDGDVVAVGVGRRARYRTA